MSAMSIDRRWLALDRKCRAPDTIAFDEPEASAPAAA
jgi:hypothetical protein